MKKMLSLLLVLAMMLGLLACGAKPEPAPAETLPAATEAATEVATEAATEAPAEPALVVDTRS